MMNNVSFTGLQNVGACHVAGTFERGKMVGTSLLVNLTNDFKGKDLTEYENVMRKCSDSFGHYFPHDKNFLHIQTQKFIFNDEDFETVPQLIVNGFPVEPETKTMPLFSYIAKLTKRIIGSTEGDIKISNDFKYGPDADIYISDIKISELESSQERRKLILDNIYSLPSAKAGAKNINNDIQAQMMDYFA